MVEPLSRYRVAVIPGDGIGPELVDSALAVLDEVSTHQALHIERTVLDGGAGTYQRTGYALSAGSIDVIRHADATLKGPVGLPDVRLPDGTEAGLLGGVLRNGLDLYANIRPVVLLPGIEPPLRAGGDIDYVIVRENTEGLYASRGKGVGNGYAMADTLLVTRAGCERVARHAFELAARRHGAPDRIRRVTCVDKANVLRSMYFFRSIFLDVATEYPDIQAECLHVDAAAQALVMRPEHFDVIVTEGMFGDILSDLGGATVGGVALCPGANVGDACAYFEPIHGSSPPLAGQDRANPIGQMLATAMMLEHLGQPDGADSIRNAVTTALTAGSIHIEHDGAVREGTRAATEAVIRALRAGAA